MRCYNGAPDSELKALWDHRAALKAEAKALGYHLTWYPAEERWGAGTDIWLPGPYRAVGPLCRSIEEAMRYVREDAAEQKEDKPCPV